MRALVGDTNEASFDNPTGVPIFADLGDEFYDSVFDLGSGCGRLARQLLQQSPRPKAYLGIDLHAGMVRWCRNNLTAADPNFRFLHHDVFELGFNPTGKPLDRSQPLPVPDAYASLIIAWSIFTHLVEDEIPYYLEQCARILRSNGVIRSTWFLFDKNYFPMMQTFQNALYINPINPTNAVIIDRSWLLGTLSSLGLTVAQSKPPSTRGFQWVIDLRHAAPGEVPTISEVDEAPFGSQRPPVGGAEPSKIGLNDDSAEEER